MELVIEPNGVVRCLYEESIELSSLGVPDVRRASWVEPTPDGRWTADLSPVSGPVLGPFALRSAALRAEADWLRDHVIVPSRRFSSTNSDRE